MSFLNIQRGRVFAARRGAAPLMVALSSVLLLVGVVFAPPTAADHGEGHNGETMELSATEFGDGDVVTLTLGNWLPGNTVTIVTCFVFPVLGPVDCELSNYGAHTVVVDDDGTATYDYPIAVVPGRCDETVTCFVVAADGVGFDANYAAQEVSFLPAADADDPVSEPSEPDPTPAPEPDPTPSPEPDPTPTPEPDPPAPITAAITAPVTAADDGDETETAIGESGDSSGTSALSRLIPVIAVAALVVVGGGLLARRRGRGDGAST